MIDNDGQYLYVTSIGANNTNQAAFVTKFDGFTGRPVLFTQGQTTLGPSIIQGGAVTYAYPGQTMTAIDVIAPTGGSFPANPPTAIAVQTGGNILAVAHGNWNYGTTGGGTGTNNVIKFFDKTTGLATGTNATISNPQSMAFDSTGNLWVQANGTVNLITSPSTGNSITQPLSGLVFPTYVAVNKANNHIYVLDWRHFAATKGV